MEKINLYLIGLLLALAGAMYWWINRIDPPEQRIIGIFIVSVISYLIGKFHEKKINFWGNRAKMEGPANTGPSF